MRLMPKMLIVEAKTTSTAYILIKFTRFFNLNVKTTDFDFIIRKQNIKLGA